MGEAVAVACPWCEQAGRELAAARLGWRRERERLEYRLARREARIAELESMGVVALRDQLDNARAQVAYTEAALVRSMAITRDLRKQLGEEV